MLTWFPSLAPLPLHPLAQHGQCCALLHRDAFTIRWNTTRAKQVPAAPRHAAPHMTLAPFMSTTTSMSSALECGGGAGGAWKGAAEGAEEH